MRTGPRDPNDVYFRSRSNGPKPPAAFYYASEVYSTTCKPRAKKHQCGGSTRALKSTNNTDATPHPKLLQIGGSARQCVGVGRSAFFERRDQTDDKPTAFCCPNLFFRVGLLRNAVSGKDDAEPG